MMLKWLCTALFASSLIVNQVQAANDRWDPNAARLEPEDGETLPVDTAGSSQVEGCCYSKGFGAFMVPVWNKSNFKYVHENECHAEQRIGGATQFEAGVSCDQVEAKLKEQKKETCGYLTDDQKSNMGCPV
eukprot:GDKI01006576.1.p2 GENE.GDKI01006576.1~~GDKI01006576.1.p2  ORF type:complete len:131 (+),score=45.82 GDKI01006576.1:122-514(+)